VIPTCANKDLFPVLSKKQNQEFRKQLGYELKDKIFIHVGTVSGWYELDKELAVFKELSKLDDSCKLLFLNRSEKNYIDQRCADYQIDKQTYQVLSTDLEQVHQYLNIADAALFVIKPSFSKQASAPTKFAENVLCQLPSITNSGVGDMGFYLETYPVGYALPENTWASIDDLNKNAKQILEYLATPADVKTKKAYAELYDKHFSKAKAVENYQKIYQELIKN
jgi:hypothetical protein